MKSMLGIILSGVLLSILCVDALAQSPGDTMGFTQYLIQSIGSTGRRVVLDDQGGVHFTWSCADPYPRVRNVKYNCKFDNGPSPWPGLGTIASYRNGSSYPQIGATASGIAALIWHQAATGAESIFIGTDESQCMGTFHYSNAPNRFLADKYLWPFIGVDRSNRYHVVATSTGTEMSFGYSRSNDGGSTWTALSVIDTIGTISPIVIASPISDKIAIAYTHSMNFQTGESDVYYIQSLDGINWNNYNSKVNITNYQNGDSLWALNEVSAVYDYNDNLHLVWSAYTSDVLPNHPFAYLFHYDTESGTIHTIAVNDSTGNIAGCSLNNWFFYFSKVSIAVDSFNRLYVAYTSWDSSDCSIAGYANGDIYLQRSFDRGSSWSTKENLTNSHSPGCELGDCYSDICPSLAEHADAYVHLFYLCDRNSTWFPNPDDPYADSPMLYLKIPAGPQFVADNNSLPTGFELSQNYPNPFNAQTTISYRLGEKCQVSLSVYNLLGQKVASLVNGIERPGEHKITWDARNIPSGVYYARLEAGEGSQTIKTTLLK